MSKHKNKAISVREDSQEWELSIKNKDLKKMHELLELGIRPSKIQLLLVKNDPELYRYVYSGFTGNTLAKELTPEDRKKASEALKNKNNQSKAVQKPRKGYAIKICRKDITETHKYKELSRNWYSRTHAF